MDVQIDDEIMTRLLVMTMMQTRSASSVPRMIAATIHPLMHIAIDVVW